MSKRYFLSPWLSFVLFFGLIIWKLFEYHCFPNPNVLSKAQSQYWGRATIKGSRGVILDSRGSYMASSVPVVNAFIDPTFWSPSDAPALKGLIPEDIYQRISNQPSGQYISLFRRPNPETAEKVLALNLKGVHRETVSRREYHNSTLLSHVLGYCNTDDIGLAGIELAWDSTLSKPEDGYQITIRQSGGRSLMTGSNGVNARNTNVSSVRLTIDARIQYIVERYLNETAMQHNAKWGAAVCIDPNTGAVLSMASWPTFDPNNREEISNSGNTSNNVVARVYEPGSTFKTIYMGIAMEEGLVRADEIFNCPVRIDIADGTISEAVPRAMGRISTADVLIRSSNVGMAQIGIRSKSIDMYRTLQNWGFGRASDIELRGVERGIMSSPNLWRGVTPANISIGQGLSVTPLHLVTGMAAVVNGGKLLSPYIVQEAIDAGGEVVYRGKRTVVRDVLTEETSAWLRRIMRETVLSGTGRRANTSVTEVAVKTGTAQVPERGKYVDGRYVSSIVGFWPYSAPQYLMLIVIGEPSGGAYFGGEVAAPAFKKIVESISDLDAFDPRRGETL